MRRAAACVLFLLIACGERSGHSPLSLDEAPGTLTCRASTRTTLLECVPASGAVPTGIQALQEPGPVTLGSQGVTVRLAGTNVAYDAGTQRWSANVTVQNLIGQPIGTRDGSTVTAEGVRVFFTHSPVATRGSGSISVLADGTGTFTAAGQPYFQYNEVLDPNETSSAKTWVFSVPSSVETFVFSVAVQADVEHGGDGWVDVTPRSLTLDMGEVGGLTAQLSGVVRDVLGTETTGPITWSSSADAVVTVDATGKLSAQGAGTATITATAGTRTGRATVTVLAALEARPDSLGAIGNVQVNTAQASPMFTVLANDVTGGNASITFVGWNAVAGTTAKGGNVTMSTAPGAADLGALTYNPPAGFEGVDSIQYRLVRGTQSSTAVIRVHVNGMTWFVNPAAALCTQRASGCGRLTSPYSSLAALAAENNGIGNNPGPGDNIFLHQSATTYPGITLLSGQRLIGQDASADLAAIVGLTPPSGSAALPMMFPVDPTRTTIGPVTLGSNNTLRGLHIAPAAGTMGLSGANFGTLTLGGDLDVSTTNAVAVQLTAGAVNGGFRSIAASGGSNGIVLNGVTSFAVLGATARGSGGTIRNTTGDGILLTNCSNVSLNYMVLSNNLGNGIRGNNVSGFTLTLSTVSANGNAADESGLYFTQLLAVSSILNSSITGSYGRNLHVANSSGALAMQLSQDTLRNTTSGENLWFDVSGTALLNDVVESSLIEGSRRYAFRFSAAGSASGRTDFLNNRVMRGSAAPLDGGLLLETASGHTGNVSYLFESNVVDGAETAAFLANSNGNGTLVGHLRNNTFGSTTPRSCAYNGIGLGFANPTGSGTNTARLTGNLVRHCYYNALWMDIDSPNNSVMNITASGNQFINVENDYPVDLEMSNVNVSAGTRMCLDFRGNTLGPEGPSDAGMGSFFLDVTRGTFQLAGYTGGDPAAFITAQNTLPPPPLNYGWADGSAVSVPVCPTPGF